MVLTKLNVISITFDKNGKWLVKKVYIWKTCLRYSMKLNEICFDSNNYPSRLNYCCIKYIFHRKRQKPGLSMALVLLFLFHLDIINHNEKYSLRTLDVVIFAFSPHTMSLRNVSFSCSPLCLYPSRFGIDVLGKEIVITIFFTSINLVKKNLAESLN